VNGTVAALRAEAERVAELTRRIDSERSGGERRVRDRL
jgi:hypothetical protein